MSLKYEPACERPAAEREGNNLKGLSLKNGSSQGQNLALTVLFVPSVPISTQTPSTRSSFSLGEAVSSL